ncbi:zinc finger protein 595-like [Lutzomyia longipalpis]|uniref:zinc finger protein 595-like n=1 Tax=Lutzomyia longipalpis TaxID=7200 RepID=UPI00248385C3|nr:zinc finger protein 595-like [Lutzomyia longipalpis]
MKNDLELFSLRHRIFLVKQFYQELGNFACVKNNYEDYYGGCSDSPLFSRDVLIEIIRLFEETGSVLKCPIIPVGGAKLEDSPLEIELVCVKTEMECADGKSEEADVKSEDDGEDFPEASFASPHPSETSLNSPKELCEVIEEDPAKATEILEDDEDDEDIKADPEECDTKGMEVDGGRKEMPKEPTVTQSLFVSCVICNHQCLRRELIKHMKSHEKKRRHTAKKLICEFCGKFFANFSRLDQHQTCHMDTKRYKCQFKGCNESFKWLSSYQRHKETHAEQKKEHLKFKCEMCMKSFLYLSNLRRHIANSHDTGVRYTCEFCSKEFRKKQKLLTHMKIHDGGVPLSEVGKKRPKELRQCEECGKMCSTATYEKHMMTHSGERPLKCEICGKGFIWNCGYKTHMLKHKGVVVKKNWPMCEICGRKMAGERTLRLHMKKIHERPEQEFKCQVSGCGRSYPNEKFLRRHMDRHNGKRHQCPLCNVDYKDKSQLKIHVDKVHSKNDPPLKCERCGKCSWSIKDHRVHMRNRHKIEIPYLRKKPQQVN